MRINRITTLWILSVLTIGYCMLTGCGAETVKTIETAGLHEITDMAGRRVVLPEKINQVYSTGQPGVIMLYTLCPDKLLGWDLKLSEEELKYINAKYLSLPVLGLMQGSNNTANKEEIIRRRPDCILFMTETDGSAISAAEEIQSTMGIPVVIADYSLKKLPSAYKFLGKLLHEKERAEILAKYCSDILKKTEEVTAKIKPEDNVTVYYAQGSNGLQTAPEGSSHSEVIDLVGGDNVVKLKAEGDGRLTIDMEQLLLYNPGVIITSYSMGHNSKGEGAFSVFSNGSKEWRLLEAVKQNRIFDTPCYPFNWLDMPPSVNRMIGIKWLGNLLYPDYYKYDIRKEVKKYYSLFYQKELSEEELKSLLEGSVRTVNAE